MKKTFRLVLFIAALATGGWLGTVFLADFEPLRVLAFFTVCGALGVAFHQIDKLISDKK